MGGIPQSLVEMFLIFCVGFQVNTAVSSSSSHPNGVARMLHMWTADPSEGTKHHLDLIANPKAFISFTVWNIPPVCRDSVHIVGCWSHYPTINPIILQKYQGFCPNNNFVAFIFYPMFWNHAWINTWIPIFWWIRLYSESSCFRVKDSILISNKSPTGTVWE